MRVKMTVPGQSDRKAGEIVSVAKESATGQDPDGGGDQDRKIEDDKFAYGDYLITCLNHRYFVGGISAFGTNYHIVVDMVRDSVEG